MHCTRETGKSFWFNFGKRFAASGRPLEAATTGLRTDATGATIRELIAKGYEDQMARKARRAAKALKQEQRRA